MKLEEVRSLLREQSGYRGLRAWCRANKVFSSHASEFLNGKRLPSQSLLDALGLEWTIEWKKGKENQ